MSSKQFTAQIFRWLYQVNADRELPASAVKVAVRLAPDFNESEGGMAWPATRTIAEDIGKSKGTVIDMVRRLQARGHLRVEWGQQGRGRSNRYWMIEKGQGDLFDGPAKGQPADLSEPEKGQPTDLNKDQPADLSGPEKVRFQKKKVSFGPVKGQPADQTLSKTHRRLIEGKSQTLAPDVASLDSNKQDSEAAFEKFWAVYPRRVAREAARKAFAKAIKRGADPEVLVAGARRYAGEREGEPPRFTKYPARWLGDGCWQDEPAGATGASGPPIIDNTTGEPVAAPRPRSGPKTWADVYEEVCEELDGDEGN